MPAVPTAPRPSPLRRLVDRWTDRWADARAAALLHELPHGEVGLDLPAPSTLAPRMHPLLRAIAHPAVWEVGIPGTAVVVAVAFWREGWHGYWPEHPFTRLLFLLFHPLWVWFGTGVGQVLLQRRYDRVARVEYSHRLWQADAAHAREATGKATGR